MNRFSLIFIALVGVSLLQGCSGNSALSGIDYNCPAPSKNQLDKNGYLMLENGITLECQVKNYTSRMSCIGVTDSAKTNGWMCSNGDRQILFIFDEDNVLKDRKSF